DILLFHYNKGQEPHTKNIGHSDVLSNCPDQAKDSNCLPLRVYPDVLRSRLAMAKSSLLASMRETNIILLL
ncbi:hypothetical protein, partial [Aneurinibacillus migulanus]|uniref:hypothetical protein n=1 Tax=Aneurinibacillus migulanus TaxID=47500 RepID=UPI001C3F8ABD